MNALPQPCLRLGLNVSDLTEEPILLGVDRVKALCEGAAHCPVDQGLRFLL